MEERLKKNRRRHLRYAIERQVCFDFAYDMETSVMFQVAREQRAKRKYRGVSRNVSAEGLCFVSNKKLDRGDRLDLEVYLPGQEQAIVMSGEVQWCEPTDRASLAVSRRRPFQTGVQLVSVEGKPVRESIYFDATYQVAWSTVLESVLGKFRVLMQQRRDGRPKDGKGR